MRKEKWDSSHSAPNALKDLEVQSNTWDIAAVNSNTVRIRFQVIPTVSLWAPSHATRQEHHPLC